jgi:hypothetical protein
VIQYRRLASLLLGVWLGASLITDFAVTQNFQTIDRFLQAPGDSGTSVQMNQIGRTIERQILRRNAGEENNWIFLNWERAELVLGSSIFILLLFGTRPQKLMIGICASMIVVVVVQHFLLSSQIAELGRLVDGLPSGDPIVRKFWTLHGVYSGLEILKLALGVFFAARLTFRPKADQNRFVREYAAALPDRGQIEMSLANGRARD